MRELRNFEVPPGLVDAVRDVVPDHRSSAAAPRGPAARRSAKEESALVHLLSRTTYGYTEAELALAREMGTEGWLDYQLGLAVEQAKALDTVLAESLPTLSMGYQEIFEAAQEADNVAVAATELVVATAIRQLYSPAQLFEVAVEFWTNHFNVFLADGPVLYFKTVDDRDHVRPHALGRFGDLLRANARSPAMLYYLDNYSNSRAGPNENYARELLELHTLGVDGGYSEEDVAEVARAFTGWTLDPQRPELFVFNPLAHDIGEKSVLGRLLPANRGLVDGQDVLGILLEESATWRNLGRKLVRRFVSDDPDADLVDQLAFVGQKSEGSIPKMLYTLFASDAFAASAGAKFKRPNELVYSMVRRLEPETEDEFLTIVIRHLDALGQLPFFAAPPTGYPDERADWLASSPLLLRWNLGSAIAYGSLPASGGLAIDRNLPPMARVIDVDMAAILAGARAPEAIVDVVVERVLHQSLPSADRATLVDLAARGAPSDTDLAAGEAESRGRAVLAAVLASDHFQNR